MSDNMREQATLPTRHGGLGIRRLTDLSWQTVRRQYRRKKNNKITGTLLHGSLVGVESIFDLYLGGCATQTSDSDVLSHIRDQCNKEAKCEAL